MAEASSLGSERLCHNAAAAHTMRRGEVPTLGLHDAALVSTRQPVVSSAGFLTRGELHATDRGPMGAAAFCRKCLE
jgi:hypothetical protein